MISSAAGVVIAIPTYRRPEQLMELLDSLFGELTGTAALLIIADNDSGESGKSTVESFRQRWSDTHYIVVRERGVSHVRNALVAECGRLLPDWRWLVMLDDDGIVTPGWLERLLECGERYQADLVGGPVDGVLPDKPNILARNSIFSARKRWPTGLTQTLNTTQNIAVSRRLLARLDLPLFRPQFGASGGEDYDLFRRAAKTGARFAWCDEAVVREPAPADRLTVERVLFRYYSTGAYAAVIDRDYDGTALTAARAAKGLLLSMARTVLALVSLNGDRSAQSILSVSHFAGRLAGLLGLRTSRYVSINKN